MSLTFYYAPHSRAATARLLLEELGVDYRLQVLDLKQNEQRAPDYLAINPMGKVPAIVHDGVLVTELPALYIYLADAFPDAGLAPGLTDPLRGPWLRWLAFYGSAFEPAVFDRAMQREPTQPSFCPYGDFDTMLATLAAQLRAGPWLLGERFSAADLLWAGGLTWATAFKLVPALPEIAGYLARVNARPAVRKVMAEDEAMAAAQA
jgi:glutathione S-transferase